MKKIKFIGLITARKNSQRVKNKNLILINKKPLLQYSLSALKKSKKIKFGFITTDCNKMSDLAKNNKIFTIKRPSNLALNNSTSEDTLKHAINYIIEKFKFFPENIVFIQPTSPLINFNDLDNGIKKYIKTKADSLFSSYKAKYFIWRKNKKNFTSLTYNYNKRISTKKFKDQIVENGAYFIFNTKKFLKIKNRLFGKIETYTMPRYRSFEIDYKEDVDFLNKLKF
tara:strand:+ start:10523 stop:11200 length:678 start_codon:yes stop_codon:yes gene_type:complete